MSTYTTGFQRNPDVAASATGEFVVVWDSPGGPGVYSGDENPQGRRYDGSGVPLGDQFRVNTYTTTAQNSPAVTVGPQGSFVVVWQTDLSEFDSGDGVSGRRYDANGAAIGDEFQVNAYTTGSQQRPAAASNPAGTVLVVWQSDGGGGSDALSRSVQGQRFAANGNPLGGQFQVNTYTTSSQYYPDVAADGLGNFIVVWSGHGAADADGVLGQRYDGNGNALGGEFQVNTYTTSDQARPAVSADDVGNFVVVWGSDGSAGSDVGSASIQARRFDSNGAPVGAEFQVNSYTTDTQYNPDVATDEAGNFVVVWESYQGAGSDPDKSVHARLFDNTGTPVGAEFQVNSYTTGSQAYPAVAASGSGDFVVVWRGDDIKGQRFVARRVVLGKKMLVKDPTGLEVVRTAIALGKESNSDIASVGGDPTVGGASLRMVAYGSQPSDETYELDAAGWTATATGYKYQGPTGVDGDPVRKLTLKRTPSGTVLLKVLLKGNVGTQTLDLVPPNPGTEGGLVLAIDNGPEFCVAFGGAAGGSVVADDARLWKITNPTSGSCPTLPTTTSSMPPPTTSTTLPSCAVSGAACGACGDGLCVRHCPGPDLVCVSTGMTGGACTTDAECTGTQICASLTCTMGFTSCGTPCP